MKLTSIEVEFDKPHDVRGRKFRLRVGFERPFPLKDKIFAIDQIFGDAGYDHLELARVLREFAAGLERA